MTSLSTKPVEPRDTHAANLAPSPSHALIRAHLNLYAVLQNLEDLVRLDPMATDLVGQTCISLQLRVHGGPAAYLEFGDGACRFRRGRRKRPNIALYFFSPRHFNAMFDGHANPVPLRGFFRLGWLKQEFTQLTNRLVEVLRPTNEVAVDEMLRATLLLQTGAFAAAELAAWDPTCQRIAARMKEGVVSVDVPPDGPYIHAVKSGNQLSIVKGPAKDPSAKIIIRSPQHAIALFENRLDAFEGLAQGDLRLAGQISLIDDFLLILDRVEQFIE